MKSINWYHNILLGEWDIGGNSIKIYPGKMTEDSVICGKILTEIELIDNPDGLFDYKLFNEKNRVYFSFFGLKYFIEKIDNEIEQSILMIESETNYCLFLIKS